MKARQALKPLTMFGLKAYPNKIQPGLASAVTCKIQALGKPMVVSRYLYRNYQRLLTGCA